MAAREAERIKTDEEEEHGGATQQLLRERLAQDRAEDDNTIIFSNGLTPNGKAQFCKPRATQSRTTSKLHPRPPRTPSACRKNRSKNDHQATAQQLLAKQQ
ncbi:hypothetical protein Q9189_006364 [Teloschistes chrysophthalmus]